jgi:DegV family protein with EDD domain
VYERYGIVTIPALCVADGVTIDTRTIKSCDDIDKMIAKAERHPIILGTPATEFLVAFTELQRTYDDIIVVATSRRTFQTYDAAISAAKTLKTVRAVKTANVHVVDAGCLDIGVGLITLFVAKALAAGHNPTDVAHAAERFGRKSISILAPPSLDYLIRSGRGSLLAASAAEFFGRRVLIEHVDGTTRRGGTFSKNADVADVLTKGLVDHLGIGAPVWVGIMHGGNPDDAKRLEEKLRSQLNVRECLCRELSVGVYLSMGRGTLGGVVFPCGEMAWPISLG